MLEFHRHTRTLHTVYEHMALKCISHNAVRRGVMLDAISDGEKIDLVKGKPSRGIFHERSLHYSFTSHSKCSMSQ